MSLYRTWSVQLGSDEGFLSNAYAYTSDLFDLPADLREKIIRGHFPYLLTELRKKYRNFIANPSQSSYKDLDIFVVHFLNKASGMAGSSREFSDAKKDFIQCYELFLDSNRTQDQKSSGGPEDETGEQYLLRTKPSIDKISVKINEILDKYSDDPRFNVDYHKLVAEIREDFAKYKAERFPTT